ncbi:MAG: VOC family protein, partial [Gammaproteobacteria bacterium]|nr:VOC family protein [Gammaproteobacteria bacterium]
MDNPGMERHGLIGWNELITNDLASAKSFYSELLDWQLTSVESENGEYAVVNVGDRKFAGMMKTPPMAGNTPPTWSC